MAPSFDIIFRFQVLQLKKRPKVSRTKCLIQIETFLNLEAKLEHLFGG